MTTEQDPRQEIGALEAQVRELRDAPAPHDTDLIAALERRIDQLWDLARQQEARRAAGDSPAEASVRPQSEVEGYLQ